MTVPAIGFGLDQRRSLSGSGAGDGNADSFMHCQHIAAINGNAGHIIGRRTVGHIGDRHMGLVGRQFGITVGFAKKHQRQLPDRRHVHGLMGNASARGALAEKRHRYSACVFHLRRQSRADTERHGLADNAVGTEHADRDIGNMHGAAAALRITRLFGEQLSHHQLGIPALGQAMAMAAVGTGDVIADFEGRANTNGAGLLTNRQMNKAGQLTLFIFSRCGLLKIANAAHVAVHAKYCLLVQFAHWLLSVNSPFDGRYRVVAFRWCLHRFRGFSPRGKSG